MNLTPKPLMTSTTTTPVASAGRERESTDPSVRPLVIFAAVAVPVGWVLLSTYQVLGLPQGPFVLATLLLGLLAPAVVLTARDGGRPAVRALLRNAFRWSRPAWWTPLAVILLPITTWTTAWLTGGAQQLTGSLVSDFVVAVIAGALIVNLWEEVAWTGFAQRRAVARWGVGTGSLVTAALFVGIHLPLAFDGADNPADVGAGLAALVATAVGLRLLIAHLDAWSGRSVLTIGLLHAAFNASYDLVQPSHDWIRLGVTVALGIGAALVTRAGFSRPARPAPKATTSPSTSR